MDKEVYTLLGVVMQGVVTMVIAYIAFKQASLTKVIEKLEINTNSMKDQLVAVTRVAGLAEGNLQGRVEQTAEQSVIAASQAPKNK